MNQSCLPFGTSNDKIFIGTGRRSPGDFPSVKDISLWIFPLHSRLPFSVPMCAETASFRADSDLTRINGVAKTRHRSPPELRSIVSFGSIFTRLKPSAKPQIQMDYLSRRAIRHCHFADCPTKLRTSIVSRLNSHPPIYTERVVIPTFSALGIVGNVLVLAVLSRQSLRASTYTYLAGADLVTCGLLLFSGLSKGIFWGKAGWLEFDIFVYLPVGSVSSNVAVLATVCVTLDRLVLVSGPVRCTPPKFCNGRMARKLMWSSLPIAIVCSIPYCFIYEYNDEGLIDTTEFFNSWWYDLQNWLQLLVFGLVPAIFLLIGNGIMIFAVGKVIRKRRIFIEHISSEGKCAREQARLTVTLVAIVFIFLVGEVPTHLASRKSAVSLLYAGDSTKVDEDFLERFRICASVLNAISSSASFILYCLLSPQFLAHLKDLVNGVRDGPRKNKLKNCKQPPKIQRFAPNEGIDF